LPTSRLIEGAAERGLGIRFLKHLVRIAYCFTGRRGPYDGSSPPMRKAIAHELENSAKPGQVAIAGWC